jgi:hypothetical protein
MKNTSENQDVLERLKALEEENARLRARSSQPKAKLIVTEGDYKGYPVLTFEGSFRRFSLGLTKLRALQEAWPTIESFLRRHEMNSADSDDPKI